MTPKYVKNTSKYTRNTNFSRYFTRVLEDKLKATIKPQYVELIPKMMHGTVDDILSKKDERNDKEEILEVLDLDHLTDRQINQLSGGELQRFVRGEGVGML